MGQKLQTNEYVIPAELQHVEEVRSDFVAYLKSVGLNEDDVASWKLVFTEILNNAILHGCRCSPDKYIAILWSNNDLSVSLRVSDPGGGPLPEAIQNPSLPKDPYAVSGRGLFIVYQFVDCWSHTRAPMYYAMKVVKNYSMV